MIAIIDADHLAMRNFYTFISFTGSEGQEAGAVYGFLNSLQTLCKQLNPYFVVICWGDSRSNLWRRELFPPYKAQRGETPTSFIQQTIVIKELLKGIGLPQILCPTFEADDCIAAIVNDCKAANKEVAIVTGDHDLFQLINDVKPNIFCYAPIKGAGYQKIDSAEVVKKYGIEPAQLPMFMALKGERGDGVPGVPGIGKKRAREFLTNCSSPATQKLVANHQELIELNLQLIDLREISSNDLTPSILQVMPHKYREIQVLSCLKQVGLTGARSVLQNIREMMGLYAERQSRGAHTMDEILGELENG